MLDGFTFSRDRKLGGDDCIFEEVDALACKDQMKMIFKILDNRQRVIRYGLENIRRKRESVAQNPG